MREQNKIESTLNDAQPPRARLIIVDRYNVASISRNALLSLRFVAFDEAVTLVKEYLYGDIAAHADVVNAIVDEDVCIVLNQTRAFGMSFTPKFDTKASLDLNADDVVLIIDVDLKRVQRAFAYEETMRKLVEANVVAFRRLEVQLVDFDEATRSLEEAKESSDSTH
jgi:hypothetical protein